MAKPASLKPAKNWKEIFIQELTRIPNVAAAARKAKMGRQATYQARYNDPDFAAAWNEALEAAIENAEGELYRRAVHGTLEPIYHSGEKVGSVRRYSDTLLIFLLKAHKPDMYRETVRNELSGPKGAPIQVEKPDLSILSMEELLALRQISEKLSDVHPED